MNEAKALTGMVLTIYTFIFRTMNVWSLTFTIYDDITNFCGSNHYSLNLLSLFMSDNCHSLPYGMLWMPTLYSIA